MGSLHRPGFCFSGMRVPRDAVPFQAPPPVPEFFRFPPAYKHLERLRIRRGLEVGEFITVKSVAGKGRCVEGEAAGISKD